MRATLAAARVVGAGLLIACGGATSSATTAAPGAPDPADRVARAADAWAALDPARAARLADEAIALGGGDDAREIAARAHLARGEAEPAIAALEGVSAPALLYLRARAQLFGGDPASALASLEAAAPRAREPDPWAEALVPALRSVVDGGPMQAVVGDSTELPLEAAPLPVVRVRVDAVETLAVIGSGSYLAVLDPSVRRAPGAIDELTLGGMRVRNVPHTVRPLAPIREALGADIGMVIGASLLVRLHAVLDGPGQRLRLSDTAAPPADGATRAPLRWPSGSFLTVAGQLGQAPAWLTVDTAGLFPIALSPGAGEALGIPEAEWQATEAGPALWLAPEVRLGGLAVEQIPLVRGLLGEDHARAAEAPIAGSLGWTLLGQLVTRFEADALYFE